VVDHDLRAAAFLTLARAGLTVDMLAALLGSDHRLAVWCPSCRRWVDLDLAALGVAEGCGGRRLQNFTPRCRVCRQSGQIRVRPPVPVRPGEVMSGTHVDGRKTRRTTNRLHPIDFPGAPGQAHQPNKMARPALKRQAVDYIVGHYALPRRRACGIVRQQRSVNYYRSREDPKLGLRKRTRELAQVRVRYGYRRLHVLLRREGWSPGKQQAYRVYNEEGLQLRSKTPRRRKMVVGRRER
jgi:hypothetical protein